MCQVVGSLETNTNGLMYLWDCIKSLTKRIISWIAGSIGSVKDFFFKMINKLMVFLRIVKSNDIKVDADIELDLTNEEVKKLKEVIRKRRIYKFLMGVCMLMILGSLLYFYSVGRSFKVKFVHKIKAAKAQGEVLGNSMEGGGANMEGLFGSE